MRADALGPKLSQSALWIATFAVALAAATAGFRLVSRAPERRAPDFSLTDQSGRPFTLSGQIGHPVVLFFGYTHCPDACPLTLAHLARALRATHRDDSVRVVFISVDPKRDTAPALRRYLALFDPKFIGLTTTPQRLETIERAYHTWSQVLPANRGVASDYAVVHGTATYFIDRRGDVRGFGNWNDSVEKVERDVLTLLS